MNYRHKRYRLFAFLWGFAEATLFFVLPDMIITYAALMLGRRSFAIVLFALLGSALGGALMYYCSYAAMGDIRSTVAAVPFVYGWMFERAASDFAEAPAFALFRQPLSGIPFKIHAVLAPEHISPLAFLCLSAVARGSRFVLSWIQFRLIAALLHRYSTHPLRNGRLLFAAYWCAVYAYYWTHIRG